MPTVVIDAHGDLVSDPQAWQYRSLSVTVDVLVLRSWQANPNPGTVDGYDVVPVGEPERMHQRFDLPALWYSVNGTAIGEGQRPPISSHRAGDFPDCRPKLCGAAVSGGPDNLDVEHPAAPVDPPHWRKAGG